MPGSPFLTFGPPSVRSTDNSGSQVVQAEDRPGKVLINLPSAPYALRHACAQDYEAFYQEEIRYRQNHSYPHSSQPVSSCMALISQGSHRRSGTAQTTRRSKSITYCTNPACPACAPESRTPISVTDKGKVVAGYEQSQMQH